MPRRGSAMSDGQVLVIESDDQQATTWRQLLEFSNYEPLVIPDQRLRLPAGARQDDWVAALIGHTRRGPGLSKLLNELRGLDDSLPLVAIGGECLEELDPLIRSECLQLP